MSWRRRGEAEASSKGNRLLMRYNTPELLHIRYALCGKHVQWLYRVQAVDRRGLSMTEDVEIAGQGRGFARYIDDALSRVMQQRLQHGKLTTGTRRIDDKSVQWHCQCGQHVFHLALENLHVLHVAQIPLRVLNRAG